MVEGKSFATKFWKALIYITLAIIALAGIAPLVHVLAVSFSDRAATNGNLVGFLPVNFTTVSYEKVLGSANFLRSFGITILRTVLGTAIMMVITVLTAFPLSRPERVLRGRNIFMGFLLFAMLFSGGLIPLFLVVRSLGMLNTIWALILPMAVPIWNIIMLMNFFRDIPIELEEAAVLDGATDIELLTKVYLPLAMPSLAALTLFSAVWLWNEWFLGMVFMQDANQPLQTYLRSIIISEDLTKVIIDPSKMIDYSNRSLKAAQIFVTTLPILVLYPFLQRYFVAGIKLGAVKG